MRQRPNLYFHVCLVSAVLLTACAVVPSPQASTNGRLDIKREVMFITDNSASPAVQTAENAIRRLLTLQGYRFAPRADAGVIVTFAERSPDLSFETAHDVQADSVSEQINAKKRGKGINFCVDRVYRLTVAVVDQRLGKVAYRGHSEHVSCDPPDENRLYNMAASATRSLYGG